MKSLLVYLDDATLDELNRIAPPSERKRAKFLRDAISRAVMDALEERTRQAYLAKPDSEEEADDWSTADEYRP